MEIPNYIVYYHHKDAKFLSSVLENGYCKAKELLKNSPVDRISRDEYVDERIEIENHIRRDFFIKGGIPKRTFPLYASLGESKYLDWQDCFTKYIIPLSVFSREQISFTHTDSMFSVHQLQPEVFMVDDLDKMIKKYGFKWPEVQIWDEKPIAEYISENYKSK